MLNFIVSGEKAALRAAPRGVTKPHAKLKAIARTKTKRGVDALIFNRGREYFTTCPAPRIWYGVRDVIGLVGSIKNLGRPKPHPLPPENGGLGLGLACCALLLVHSLFVEYLDF